MKRSMKGLLSMAVLAALALPVVSNAKDTAVAESVDQCVQTFVSQVVPEGHPVQILRDQIRVPVHSLYSAPSRVVLIAKGAETGKTYGRATCLMSSRGALVAVYVRGSNVRLASNSAVSDRTG